MGLQHRKLVTYSQNSTVDEVVVPFGQGSVRLVYGDPVGSYDITVGDIVVVALVALMSGLLSPVAKQQGVFQSLSQWEQGSLDVKDMNMQQRAHAMITMQQVSRKNWMNIPAPPKPEGHIIMGTEVFANRGTFLFPGTETRYSLFIISVPPPYDILCKCCDFQSHIYSSVG